MALNSLTPARPVTLAGYVKDMNASGDGSNDVFVRRNWRSAPIGIGPSTSRARGFSRVHRARMHFPGSMPMKFVLDALPEARIERQTDHLRGAAACTKISADQQSFGVSNHDVVITMEWIYHPGRTG